LATGSTVEYSSNCDAKSCNLSGGGNVGGEWEYLGNLNTYGANAGLSSTGLNVFGNPNLNGDNLQNPKGLDGLEFGLASAGDLVNTGNGGVTSNALIKNSVVFTLPFATGTTPDISDVTFQYGTSLNEGTIPGVPPKNPKSTPEPNSLVLLLGGLGLLGVRLWKRDKVSARR
jgi:hypothetical protein